MDILKSEILRKRQLVEDRNLLVENKKYFKRSELAKKEEEAYFERCGYKEQLCLPLHILEEKGLGQVAVTVQALLELAPPKQQPQQQPPQLSAV